MPDGNVRGPVSFTVNFNSNLVKKYQVSLYLTMINAEEVIPDGNMS